ncbi:hypothetical protein [Kitasatospora sp. NPDC059599]|uniref:hypothetical protein n=1 Tax=Kitasatospora sp. NPDC059599 TaxID=3346880 RepID=UPI003694CE2D
MADKNSGSGGPSGIGDRPQDDFVARNLSDPSERPPRTLTLSGLLGDSDRTGFRRLYFNKQLDYYAEFASADVLSAETVDSDRPPFVGLDATKVTLRRDATVHFTQVAQATPVDEFDLDLRLGPRRPGAPQGPATLPGPTFDGCRTEFGCPTEFNTGCRPHTCQCTDAGCVTFDATCRCTANPACVTFDATCRCTAGPVCGTVATFRCTVGVECGNVDTFRCTAGPACGTVDTLRCTGPACGTFPTLTEVPGEAPRIQTGAPCLTEFAHTCQTCPGDTCSTCDDSTCNTCHGATCHGATCQGATCQGATCHDATCQGATCHTCVTCHTCATCATCAVCQTRSTCNPDVLTCGPNPQCTA